MTGSFDQHGAQAPGPQQYNPQFGAPGQQGFPVQQGFPGQQGFSPVKKRKKWPWVLLGIFVLFILLIGSCSFFVYRLASGPIDATNAYVGAIDESNYAEAYDLLCQREQTATPFPEWQAQADDENITGYSFTSVQNTNGRTTVSGNVEIDGVPEFVEFSLVKENDEWKVCGVN